MLRKIDTKLKREEYFSNNVLHVGITDWHVPTPRSPIQPSVAARSMPVSLQKPSVSVKDVFVQLIRHPVKYLCHNWNWKSALLSSILRASLFFTTNLSAGLPAAIAALKTELVFRAVTSGFYGAITEAFREAEPPWTAALAVMFLLPLANHSIELLVHWIRGTQNLFSSIFASMVLTAFSTLFNFYVMRRGAMIVGAGRRSLGTDLSRMPKLTLDFITWLPLYLIQIASRGSKSGPSHGD
jgi:hypothetical protein